ncbi:MAG: hypothetical protein RLZZ618_4102 [Pseudomonadota bacterium]
MIRLRPPLAVLAAASLMLFASASRADDYADIDRLFGAGQLSEALQKADQSLSTNPKDARLRFLRGLLLSEMGKTPEAIEQFVKLSADHPHLPEPYNNLAVLYGKQGQYDQARRSLEAAIRTNPSYATAYENLGDVYAKLASQAYSKALQIDGSNQKVTPKLAMIRELFSPAGAARTVATAAPAAPRPTAAPPAASPPPVAATTVAPAAKPAPAPAAAASAKPVPVPPVTATKPAPAPAAVDTAGPQNAVSAWAAAWSRKDVPGYIAAYTRDYPSGKNRKAWESERRARIVGKKNISVTLNDFRVDVKGDKAVVEFQQHYSADTLKVSGRKRLDLIRVGGQWLIQKESTGS